MCMNRTMFLTKWCKVEKAWVGVGYKSYEGILDSKDRPNWSKYHKGLKPRVWMAADGDWANSKKSTFRTDNLAGDYSYFGSYPRGFHIWTNIDDAKRYNGGSLGVIAKVLFKNVIAFGTNYCGNSGDRPCIISEYMKVLEVVEKLV